MNLQKKLEKEINLFEKNKKSVTSIDNICISEGSIHFLTYK
jgi:hypothetical protein